MSSIPIGVIIVTILFGSAMLTMVAARLLPDHHLTPETKAVVSVSMAVVGTVSAMVVGLLISTANSSFTAETQEVTQISADVIDLDRLLQRYGPEAQDPRLLLRHYTAAMHQDLFPENSSHAASLESDATISVLEVLQNKILALTPTNDTQRWLRGQALQLTGTVMAAYWKLGQENGNKSPLPLLVLVMFWFVIIFASFGLFAPRNMTAIAAIFLSSVAIGGAIRMTTELQIPFQGLVRISGAPLVHALQVIAR